MGPEAFSLGVGWVVVVAAFMYIQPHLSQQQGVSPLLGGPEKCPGVSPAAWV